MTSISSSSSSSSSSLLSTISPGSTFLPSSTTPSSSSNPHQHSHSLTPNHPLTQLSSSSSSPSTTAAYTPSPDDVLKVKIKAVRFVGTWRWNISDPDDVCGICRLGFETCCPTCHSPGDDCPPMVGNCKHAFHLHCIMTWLQAKDKEQVCPLCRQDWEIGVQ